MRDQSPHHASEWTHESPTRVSPYVFDALCRVLGRTVAQSMQQHSAVLPAPPKSGKSPEQVTRELYRVALSRDPSPSEVEAAVKHLTSSKDRRQAVEDLGWVLINSKEFLFRH